MKRRLIIWTCLAVNLILLTCHATVPPSCNVSKPIEELAWLKAIVDNAAWSTQSIRINQATYKGSTVYQVENSTAVDAGIKTLYDCRGDILCQGYTTITGFKSDCKSVFNETKIETLLYQR